MKSSQKRAHPPDALGLLERYMRLLDAPALESLSQAIQRPLAPALRANTLKCAPNSALQGWAAEYGWLVEPVPYCSTGWKIREWQMEPSRTLEHRQGFYYLMEAASMLPVELFDLQEGAQPLVLDMAASPGGKTTHLACRLNDRGVLLANDLHHKRIPALRTNLRRWGTASTILTRYPGEMFGRAYPELFDLVLLDAPCSGEDLRGEDARSRATLTPQRRLLFQQAQAALIGSAFQALKPGGQLVYATCTLAPEEDEAVVDMLLKKYPGRVEVVSVAPRLPTPAPGLLSAGAARYHPSLVNAVRLWPHLYDTAGFFAALLRKLDAAPPPAQAPSQPAWRSEGYAPMEDGEVASLARELHQEFGVDLEDLLQGRNLVLCRRDESVFAAPQAYFHHLAGLAVLNPGLEVGEYTPDGFLPAHAFISRFEIWFTARRVRLTPEQAHLILSGHDLHGFDPPYPRRAVLLLEDERGRFLGRGRLLPGRVRNLSPRWNLAMSLSPTG